MNSYADFLAGKQQANDLHGFKPVWMPSFLFPFQSLLVKWAIEKGHAALFAACGLGKTAMQLTWAENIVRKTNKRVLILTPLAVAPQTVREGNKFGIPCKQSRRGVAHAGITVTNYERLHHFDPKDFVGTVCDESSILKSFGGKLRRQITDFMRSMKYRLLCSATPAPNDYVELGNSSDALGGVGRNQMLRMFFLNVEDPVGNIESTHHYRLKGHARDAFWRWLSSWARVIRQPSDLGCSDKGFILPKLTVEKHVVASTSPMTGLFRKAAISLNSQRRERRETLHARCEKAAEIVPKDRPALLWCHLNSEGDLLERVVKDAVQVQGSDADELKEERLLAFADGQIRVLVTKPRIGGFGLNFQRCADMTFFPSHSWEQWHQCVRRCWRFGQENPVLVSLITSEAESRVLANMQRKERLADEMYSEIVSAMSSYQKPTVKATNGHTEIMRIPIWLKSSSNG